MTEVYYEWDAGQGIFTAKPKPGPRSRPVEYRLATNADRTGIIGFYHACAETEPEVYSLPEDFEEIKERVMDTDYERHESFALALALSDGRIAGEVSLSWYFDDYTVRRIGVIPGLWILKPYRLAGIGRGLISFARQESTRLGIHRVELVVGKDNLAARRFYERVGFVVRDMGQAILEL